MDNDDPKIITVSPKEVKPKVTFPLKPIYSICVLDGILAIILFVFLIFHVGSIWTLYTEILNKLLELCK